MRHSISFSSTFFSLVFLVFLFNAFLSFATPVSSFAQTDPKLQVPDTIEGAKEGVLNIGDRIMEEIPGVISGIWNKQIIPTWKKMGEWIKTEVWEKRIAPALQSLFDRVKTLFSQEVEKRKPLIREEFEKEKAELKEDIKQVGKGAGRGLWARFQDLFREE